jgi:N-acetylmuramoyl-L-alanine amidase
MALTGLPAGSSRAAVIVIDPGHGGNDGGAASGGNSPEKQFTLDLSQRIARALSPAHQVTLTRTSDIGLAPADRAGLANHLKADLLISIHAAVPPLCNRKQAAIFIHDDGRLHYPAMTSVQAGSLPANTSGPWHRLQMRHRQQSKRIAEAMRQSLANSSAFDSVLVADAPLVVLMGADMPALLVEVGCIQPSAAPDPQVRTQRLADYADAIAGAIDAAMGESER